MKKDIKVNEFTTITVTYEQYVDYLIRERYSQSEEFAILRQRDTKPTDFAEYNAFCEDCKARAREVFEINQMGE